MSRTNLSPDDRETSAEWNVILKVIKHASTPAPCFVFLFLIFFKDLFVYFMYMCVFIYMYVCMLGKGILWDYSYRQL